LQSVAGDESANSAHKYYFLNLFYRIVINIHLIVKIREMTKFVARFIGRTFTSNHRNASWHTKSIRRFTG